MTLVVHRIVSGSWRQNGYIVEGPSRDALFIDPGGNAEEFRALVTQRELRPLAIINTHAHYDHIGAVAQLAESYELPFFLHGGDWALLRQANLYKLLFDGKEPVRIPVVSTDLSSLGAPFQIGEFKIDCVATPGHTKGGVCFQLEDTLFSGDTLFPSGLGRVDLPGGSAVEMRATMEILQNLPPDLTVYPGHGKSFRLGDAIARLTTASVAR